VIDDSEQCGASKAAKYPHVKTVNQQMALGITLGLWTLQFPM